MDTYADDLLGAIQSADLKDVIMVGHSTRRRRRAPPFGSSRTERAAVAVLISAVPPLMLKTDKNPSHFCLTNSAPRWQPTARSSTETLLPFYGYNRPRRKF
jgi:non-heme chloroperoxidase